MSDQAVLMLVTSHSQLTDDKTTGLWFEEFAVPYEQIKQAGFEITVASIQGGKAPVDQQSLPKEGEHAEAMMVLENTIPLTDVAPANYCGLFIPGGHGTMFDLPNNPAVAYAIGFYIEKHQPVAAVCHGVCALINDIPGYGPQFVKGRILTSFTNEEEHEVAMTNHMPFLLETRLRELGADYRGSDNWSDHIEIDGLLITGQNPQSSESTAKAFIRALKD